MPGSPVIAANPTSRTRFSSLRTNESTPGDTNKASGGTSAEGHGKFVKDVRDTPHKCLTRAGFAPEFPRIAGVLNNGCLKCVGARTLLAGCHVDYDIPDFLSGFHVTIGLDDFVERIAPVDDRAVFARLDARL